MNQGHADVLPGMAATHGIALLLAARAAGRPSSRAGRALRAGVARLLLWQERATQRHRLSMAEEHMLRDVGLTRAAVAGEIRKPFWRP
jgi:uncharacterized protein YjiS (DUF1127 family)